MARPEPELSAAQRPTRVRYGVLGFACALSMITYLDRAAIASAAPAISHDLGLQSDGDLKGVYTAFLLAYSLFEIPSGWLGDVFGPRKTLIRIVLWWSAFTALTGIIGWQVAGYTVGSLSLGSLVVTPLAVLVVVRFLFGMGEAGAYPNITRALHNWLPFRQRGSAQGMVWMSGRLMGGLTPLVWLILVEGLGSSGLFSGSLSIPPLMHWRMTFVLFGVVGVVWCTLFALWFRNRPEEKPSVNAAELALIRADGAVQQAHAGVPWGRIVRSRNLWLLCLMYACQSYGWYFYITYLPTFLQNQHGVSAKSMLGAVYKGGPLWMGAIGCLVGGLLTDWYIRRTGNRRMGRRVFGVLGHSLTVVCFVACAMAPSAFWVFLTMSLGGFFTDLTMGSSWALCQDIGRKYAAIVAGCMNMIGNLGGTLATWTSGYVLQKSLELYCGRHDLEIATLTASQRALGQQGGYQLNFFLFAGVFVLSTLCWLRIDSTKPVAE